MLKMILITSSLLYALVSLFLFALRIDYSGVNSARGVGFSVFCGTVAYILSLYLFTTDKKSKKVYAIVLLLTSFIILAFQVWFRAYYPNAAL